MMIFLRQVAFNIAFYGSMALFCIILTPMMLLPRDMFVKYGLNSFFKMAHLLEKYIIGLDFEVRGLENLPKEKSFLIAAKHYSAYETFKLNLLFGNAAIIMKKELQYIPLWGWLAMRANMIFVERGSGKSIDTILSGALRVKEEGRPLAIFPQGTRVPVDGTPDQYPYKKGILRMYEATNLPIMPMATNSGLFWAKKAFYKYPGTAVFEFLPVIPAGLPAQDVMTRIQDSIETASNRLIAEARAKEVMPQ